jgi:ParB-like chromosome segregation protein Spo0J
LKALYVAIDSIFIDPSNAMTHDEANLSAIKGSLARFGQQKPIVVDKNNVVRAGNGTLQAAKALGWDKIWVAKSALEGAEMTAYALADNRTAQLAKWDDEVLGKTLQSLREIDFPLTEIGFDTSSLDERGSGEEKEVGGEGKGDKDNLYTKKIEAPIYEPTGEKPEVESLVDCSKEAELLNQIKSAKIPDEIKAFLRLAAARHNVFNYHLIAEYYAHASAEVQELMENSALVIIDFKKAIEQGFVAMSKKLSEAYGDDE